MILDLLQRISLTGLCFISIMAMSAKACPPVAAGNLTIGQYWVRPSTGPNTAAYLTITNTGGQPDRLLKVDCPEEYAATVELHNHIEEGGVMKMRPVAFIEIGPNPVEMKPGGLHIMLMGLKAPFSGKEMVPLTLHFEKAGEVEVTFPVKAP